ncbi:MSF1-like protein, putative [Plasmodium knowlesi strain H]|uniref:MSF1-like protein, putative n=3 Tax=Plasmodium knowlesi TaxID=5850 RepID=A0A5K1UU65_PLAKH|nr:PRELI domain-containing protein, putative [Plasmodium knowlesi strain H]OTN65521.1 putative MSF1-like protein [Plasmodium knowlesi]CAA9989370.1 PRELI domain-containing protein, putative [Plasmodium knowlesi strain H]SBO24949.1 MSF1-like protein, putative [Plasmodium knowlesi strain H]SBO27902.1 MSF1-like protein, putative [Plasmodium knowlesi strain H]VVS78844.1 PRELI domain-containing protein, putative [Plasmodium knowlesi strain H]|eukprot:XP_002260097.1 MSF1-like protein, putative [Plasmodium knowlesi strain H]
MKLFEQEHMYQYDWGTVTSAFLQKYPNNVQNHIKSIDVTDRCIDTKEQTLRMRRIVHLQYFIPKLFRNLLNIDGRGVGIEDIDINLREKKLTMSTVNYTLTPFVNLTEKCVYLQKDDDDNQTHYKQTTTLDINGFSYMKSFLERAIINTVREKSKQGINIMNETIKRVINDNVDVDEQGKGKK